MPSRSDDAFVLARYPYRERDLIVTMLAREGGQVRLLARRARGVRSQLAPLLEPLALLRVTYFERRRSELATLDEAVLLRSSFPLAAAPLAWAVGQVVAELAILFCPPGERQEPAFRLVDRCVAALLAGHPPLAVAHYAELWFLRLAGIFPELGVCGRCGAALGAGTWAYDLAESTFLCSDHPTSRNAVRLSAAAVTWLRDASRSPIEKVLQPAPDNAAGWLAALREAFTGKELMSWRYVRHLIERRGQ
jgi:DNA repair protein RecO